jgi:hypothetical protein
VAGRDDVMFTYFKNIKIKKTVKKKTSGTTTTIITIYVLLSFKKLQKGRI